MIQTQKHTEITGNYKLKLPLPKKGLANNFDTWLNEPNNFENGPKRCE